MTQLALFDLDHTLLPCDSDYEWGQFLARIGVVDSEYYAKQNERFYQDYKEGKLDIQEFLRFALKPLSEHSREQLKEWHDAFMKEVINGQLRQQAIDLVKRHQDAGDLCCVITATNSTVDLCGALGVECWALVDARPQWRYSEAAGAHEMWFYESVRTFRQSSDDDGDWSNVVKRVSVALAQKQLKEAA